MVPIRALIVPKAARPSPPLALFLWVLARPMPHRVENILAVARRVFTIRKSSSSVNALIYTCPADH